MEKLDGNYTRITGYLPPITKTNQVRQTRHAGHCWRSRDELISDVLLWTPTYCQAKAGRPARTYIQQLCEDMGCGPEDLPEEMNDREKCRERVRDIRACGTTWWWWWSIKIVINTGTLPHFLITPVWNKRPLKSLYYVHNIKNIFTYNYSAIFSWSILARRGSTPTDGSNSTVWNLNCVLLNWIVWNRTVFTFNCV